VLVQRAACAGCGGGGVGGVLLWMGGGGGGGGGRASGSEGSYSEPLPTNPRRAMINLVI